MVRIFSPLSIIKRNIENEKILMSKSFKEGEFEMIN